MSQRKILFTQNEYYHIYNRGNSKQTIFHDKSDYERFLRLLYLSNNEVNFKVQWTGNNAYEFKRETLLVNIGAYCLMPNHFHILIAQRQDGGISKFMQKLSTAYSMYFNKRYERTGTLFEGKFKAQHVNEDEYLKYLFSYVHLNPVKLIDKNWRDNGIRDKQKTMRYLNQYKYSSYQDYLGFDRIQGKIMNRSAFPKYFLNKISAIDDILDWLNFNKLE